MTKVIWSTKIAIQQKGYQFQADNELQVVKANHIMEEGPSLGAQTCTTDFGGTSVDAVFLNGAVWELSSAQLWQYYESGGNWNQLGWIPGGYLGIQVTHLATKHNLPVANVILEFGHRAFVAEGVSMPRSESTRESIGTGATLTAISTSRHYRLVAATSLQRPHERWRFQCELSLLPGRSSSCYNPCCATCHDG